MPWCVASVDTTNRPSPLVTVAELAEPIHTETPLRPTTVVVVPATCCCWKRKLPASWPSTVAELAGSVTAVFGTVTAAWM